MLAGDATGIILERLDVFALVRVGQNPGEQLEGALHVGAVNGIEPAEDQLVQVDDGVANSLVGFGVSPGMTSGSIFGKSRR